MTIYTLYPQLNKAPVVEVKVGDKLVRTKELINVSYSVHAGQEFATHLARNLKLEYVKRELDWYIRANRWDDSIVQHAKIWAGCISKDGGINSNYGQYLIGSCSQLSRVVKELERDINSRRAVAMILGQHTLHFAGVDQPCTMGLQFLARQGRLDCIATMRSQDAIFGLSNDVPAFMFLLKVVAKALNLAPSTLHVNVGSLHVYDRHFVMVESISADLYGWYCNEVLPNIQYAEAINIINGYGYGLETDFGKWMRELS
jgi:thymidylate synthase